MWQESVLPRLRQKLTGEIILSRIIKTFRLAEAKVDELAAHVSKLSNPTLATYVKPDGVYLRITAKGRTKAEAQRLVTQSEVEIRSILSSYIWGIDDDTLDSVIGELLKTRSLSLATMESCTEGLICSTIASGRESSACFKGGLLACCDEAKATCGVDISAIRRYGGENPQLAKAMAETARRNLRSDIGMGVAGNIDMDKNSGDAYICLCGDRFEQAFAHKLHGNHSRMKQRAVYAALFDLRRVLLEEA
jgi:nicotinamide-nucleotide amidase